MLPTNPLVPETLLETEEEVDDTPERKQSEFTPERMAELLLEQQRLADERLAKILQGPQTRGQPLQEEIKVPGLSYEGLPHPQHDLDGFLKGLEERRTAREKALIDEIMRQTEQRVEQRTDQKNSFERLAMRAEALIRQAAPELTDKQIQFSATEVADQYKARGIDPREALQGDLMGVSQEVLDYALDMFGEKEEEPLARRGNRTGGIAPGGNRLPRPKAKSEDESSNVVQEIRKIQSELRLY